MGGHVIRTMLRLAAYHERPLRGVPPDTSRSDSHQAFAATGGTPVCHE